MKEHAEGASAALDRKLGEMDALIERLHGVIDTAGDLCGVASRMADKLVGEEPEVAGDQGVAPARPGGNLGYIHGQLDEMEWRLRGLDLHLTRIARL